MDPYAHLLQIVEKHWGFRALRPLQEPAMRAVLEGRDSLVVLPTGGGKSLCYQAPAVARGDTTVVISPLISLMKDQVDGLRESGVSAAQIDSSLSPSERSAYEMDVAQGQVRLLFIAPERLVNTDLVRLLQRINVRTFAIDEAHCISHWGHDFRPEYRQLNRIREFFPGASIHAYTATATQRVRQDIINQLALKNPAVLVGNFDRPNLTYRVVNRDSMFDQVEEVLSRHRGEAGIIYCIRRRDVDELAAVLKHRKYNVRGYHAGMLQEERQSAQDAFATENCDLIVATVAFGMGIDRSNIRFVLHTGMPKSIEHYQQETGRAGRDGLEAECVLLHSGGDVIVWKKIMEKSASEPGVDPAFLQNAFPHLNDMDHYCRAAACRHRALVEYFGQQLPGENCAACDLCLGDKEPVADALTLAQKILSCVARVKDKFGAGHIASVLRGENTEKVRRFGHDQLTTYGLLRDNSSGEIRDWIQQLIGQHVLAQEELAIGSEGRKVPIVCLNDDSWQVMKGQRSVRLLQVAATETAKKSKADTISWEGVDRELFDALRELRKQLAEQRHVPPYVIFTDSTLRQMAAMRPSSANQMRQISGVGLQKLTDFCPQFQQIIDQHCQSRDLSRDQGLGLPPPLVDSLPSRRPRSTPSRELAIDLFREGTAIDDVIHQTGKSRSTVEDYLSDYIRQDRPASIAEWVKDEVYRQVAKAAKEFGTARLKPIFLALEEKVSYGEIRIVLAHLEGKQTV